VLIINIIMHIIMCIDVHALDHHHACDVRSTMDMAGSRPRLVAPPRLLLHP
jgi:hypothetical protein